MIKLTEVTVNVEGEITEEKAVYIPAEVVVKPWRTFTNVIIPGAGSAIVKQSPEEVARKVVEYKLSMASYNVYLAGGDVDSAIFERNYVKRLAGLEESQ